MPTFNYLPGTIVNIQDGGLASQFAPTNDAILVIGTAGQGVANSPYQVFDRGAAATEFGVAGSLERTIEELAISSNNIIAFRMGTKPLVLSGVGLATGGSATPGVTITFSGDITSDSASNYTLWYDDGVLLVWDAGEIVYSNQSDAPVDTGNIDIDGTVAGNAGLPLYKVIGGSTSPDYAHSITVTAATTMTGADGTNPDPIITQTPVDGTSLTGRELYVAVRQAMDLLEGVSCKIVYVPDAVFDQPNVAYYVGGNAVTYKNNPVTNPDALDWLLVTQDPYGENIYQWASENTNSAGASVAKYGGLTTTSTTYPVPVITPSTTSAASTAAITFGASGDLVSGSLSFQMGLSGPNITALFGSGGITLTEATAAIAGAIAGAGQTAHITVALASETITITGTEDSSVNGTNTLIATADISDNSSSSTPGFASATARQGAGFFEVNYGGTIGNFCAALSEIGPLVVATIGTYGPSSTTLVNTRKWVGFLPTYNQNGEPITDGAGLLGLPTLVGCTSTILNPLCADYSAGFRLPGMFVTDNFAQDGIVQYDNNGNPVDAGAHLHVVADWAFMSNGWASNYVQNIAGLVAGFLSALDPASGLTNKPVNCTQIWQATPPQMDALTEAKISVLRSKGVNLQPVLLHDLTAATNASDYTNFVRVRCMALVIQTLLNRANNYIGMSSLDGLTLVAMTTQLDQDLVNLTKRGYCNHSTVTVSSTLAQQKIGHATLNLTVHPADELIQLTANVGVGQ